MSTRAGRYSRLSDDANGTKDACERQELDQANYHTGKGWTTVDTFRDNDISAYQKRKRRPQFERMLHAIEAGEVDVITVYRVDRLARQPMDLERFITACEQHKVQLVSLTEPEFSGITGLMMLRLLVNLANYESAVKGQRERDRNRYHAERGERPHGGRRTFGFNRDFSHHKVEAPLVREAYNRTLLGESGRSIAHDWNARGITSTGGGAWTPGNFRRMLRTSAYAGYRTYHGTLHEAQWEPLVERERWEQVCAITEGRRTPGSQGVRKYALTGMAKCGRCGQGLWGVFNKRLGKAQYKCHPDSGCAGVSITLDKLENTVLARVAHVITTPRFQRALSAQASRHGTDSGALLVQIREDEASLEQLAKDHYVERAISRPEYQAARMGLEERITTAKGKLAGEAKALLNVPTEPGVFLQEWEAKGPVWQRAQLEALIREVRVLPTGHNRHVDRVEIDWLV